MRDLFRAAGFRRRGATDDDLLAYSRSLLAVKRTIRYDFAWREDR